MARKRKAKLPVFRIVEMPKWKSKILDVVTGVLFPGEAYFVLTIDQTDFKYDGEHYYDIETGNKVL